MKNLTRQAAALLAAAALALPGIAVVTTAAATAQAVSTPAAAQPPAGGSGMHGHAHMQQMLDSLNLSDAQKSQIQSIMASTKAKSANADPETRHANMRAAMDQIHAILTPAQQTQLQNEMQAARAAHENGMPGPSPSPR